MNLIIDSNILFSALIKDSKTRKIILEYDGFFLFPSFVFEEMQKHKAELLKKSKMPEGDFNKLLQLILRKVFIIPNEVLLPYRKEAFEIVKNIDPDDAVFVACALAYNDSLIWSNDKKLKKQSKVKVFDTKEIVDILKD